MTTIVTELVIKKWLPHPTKQNTWIYANEFGKIVGTIWKGIYTSSFYLKWNNVNCGEFISLEYATKYKPD